MQTIVTITGPTCSGKSTLARYLEQNGIPEVRSFTTRAPRHDDTTYDFMTWEGVEALTPEEVIEKVEFNGNYYGSTVKQMNGALAKGAGIAAVVVDPHGVRQWKEAADRLNVRVHSIYLDQTFDTLLRRFLERCQHIHESRIPYEAKRLAGLMVNEFPKWRHEASYDLVVSGLGDGEESLEQRLLAYLRRIAKDNRLTTC